MKMTKKLAQSLYNDLICLSISAMSDYKKKELSEQEMCIHKLYAKNAFRSLADEWEEISGEKWEIVLQEEKS